MKRICSICQLYSRLLIVVILLLSSGVLTVHSDNDAKNVLVLNSYHEGLSWTNQETDGILESLEESNIEFHVSVEYMDWKNYPTEENSNQLYNLLKYKYAEKNIDVIITTDDAALNFALKNRAELLSDAPIVFCGVNAEGINELTVGYSRVTGITEIVDPERTVRAALEIKPDIKEIYVIFDNSESGLSTGAMTIQAIKNIDPNIKINTVNKKSMQEVLNEVEEAPEDSIALITTYYRDYYGITTDFEEFTRKVSVRSKVPVFHLYDFGIGNGAIGGSMLSGRVQGEGAGRMAVRILNGEQVSQIPIEASQNTRYIFDYEQLARFNIPIDKLPDGSEVINKPRSFFEDHKSLAIIAGVAFSILVGFIIALVFYLGKINRMRKELQKSNEELAEAGNKLKKQYDELASVQRSLTSSENRFSLLYKRMLNGLFIFELVANEEGKIIDIRFLDANPGVKLQTGKSSKGVIGKTWTEVFKYPNNNLSIYQKILRSGEPKHFETYYPKDNVYYLINAFKISDNQVATVFENITEYKEAIKKITVLNEELEQRVADRTEELQSVVNELEAFTYTVSHDLKSPLRAVDGYSRIILEDFRSSMGEEASEMIQNIRNICSDMIEMISKLLQYSTTSKAAIDKTEINSEVLFKSIFSDLISANPDRVLKLIIETGLPIIFADKVMLRQAVYNILSNAVKFTKYRDQGLITIGCTIVSEEYIFYIKDNGVGFDMEFSRKLFGIFQRLHTNDEFEGSGIGLVTVRKIIHKHGGRVWIEGEIGVGATVYFTLPMELQ